MKNTNQVPIPGGLYWSYVGYGQSTFDQLRWFHPTNKVFLMGYYNFTENSLSLYSSSFWCYEFFGIVTDDITPHIEFLKAIYG